jgi:hypothetical protein
VTRGVDAGRPLTHTGGNDKFLNAGPVAREVVAVNPYAFEGLEASDIQALRASGAGRFCDRTDGLDCLIEAPVELPTGTTVERLELDAVDNGPLNVKANFNRCPIGADACSLLAEISTDGAPGATGVGVDLATPEVIANQDFTYMLEVFPGNDALTSLNGVRLIVSGPESATATETLALVSFAFEGRSPMDRVALRAPVGIGRYCDGAPCTLVAPVELPSGGAVSRIGLDAVDNGSGTVAAVFRRCEVTSAICGLIAAVSTDTDPTLDLAIPEIIDNDSFTYVVEVSLGATNETQLLGFRVDFTQPSALPKRDRLTIGPFAFEGLDADNHAAIGANGGERFCDGRNCTMLAPVDLPSGTRVDRLELSGWDTSPTELRAALLRCPSSADTCSEVTAVPTSGAPGAVVVGVDFDAPEVIDNSLFTYAVEVRGGPNAATSLRAVSLSFERSLIFSDGFGSGDATSWSASVP